MTYQTYSEIPQIPEPGEGAGWLAYRHRDDGGRDCLDEQAWPADGVSDAVGKFADAWLSGNYCGGEEIPGEVTVDLVELDRDWEPTGRRQTVTLMAEHLVAIRDSVEVERIGDHWWASARDANGEVHTRRGDDYAAAHEAAVQAAAAVV